MGEPWKCEAPLCIDFCIKGIWPSIICTSAFYLGMGKEYIRRYYLNSPLRTDKCADAHSPAPRILAPHRQTFLHSPSFPFSYPEMAHSSIGRRFAAIFCAHRFDGAFFRCAIVADLQHASRGLFRGFPNGKLCVYLRFRNKLKKG